MKKFVLTGIAAAAVAATSSADVTGAVTVDYTVTAEDFGGTMVTVNVSDLYLTSNDGADTVLNVYNMTMAAAGQVSYFQSATGTGWQPANLGGIFDTEALQFADSFVTIGGFSFDGEPAQSPGAGSGTGGPLGAHRMCCCGHGRPRMPEARGCLTLWDRWRR